MIMRIYVAGIHGMAGSAIADEALRNGHTVIGKSSKELDLTNRNLVFQELSSFEIDALVIAAAKVGGIGANLLDPVNFLSLNLQIQTNLLDAAHYASISKVLFLGSSCIYPKFAPQPIPESALLTGALESSNEPYAIAKIAGLKLVESYRRQYNKKWISVMPNNLYGPRDNFDLNEGHALPAMIHRFHLAKIAGENVVEIWGDGTPLREFLFVEDLARACLLLLEEYDEDVAINVGSGSEVTIKQLAEIVSKVVEFKGEIVFRSDLPNGSPRKILDSSRINNLGWSPQMNLGDGISSTYRWFTSNYKNIRGKLD